MLHWSPFPQILSVFLIVTASLHFGYSGNFEDEPFQNIDPNTSKTRGSNFFLGFMNNRDIGTGAQHQVALFITTEEVSSTFTVETKFPGVDGFVETSPGSGLFSRSEVATRGTFTVIHFPSGGVDDNQQPLLDITVQRNNDRNKGVHVRATDPSHELTIYAFSKDRTSIDGYMAISCTSHPTAKDYRYFVFSAGFTGANVGIRLSRFLIVPGEDDTHITIDGTQSIESPSDMRPSVAITDPRSINEGQRIVSYGRSLNQFETLMIDSPSDLTGTIILSDKPISVFTGHQCGQILTGDQTCSYLVEQIPPHTTYGSLFFTAPFAARESGDIYRIGSIREGASVAVTCLQEGSSNIRTLTSTINETRFYEFRTNSGPNREFCSIQSNQSVTVMGYTLAHGVGDPSMVYIPPVEAYLNNYTITTAHELTNSTSFAGFISYVLPTRIFDNSQADQSKFRVNDVSISPESGYQPIYCSVNDSNEICAYGAYHDVNQGEFTIQYGIGVEGFGLYSYGFSSEEAYAYTTPFKMEPLGLAWIQGEDLLVNETAGTVTLPFRRFAGDVVLRSRAFARTRDGPPGQAQAGSDYTANDPAPEANSNLRWKTRNAVPNREFTVDIHADDVPEPVEYLEVVLNCDGNENCYIPRSVYRITIIDNQGQCEDLLPPEGVTVDYSFERFPLRPFGTTAIYQCSMESTLAEPPTMVCDNGVWRHTNDVMCPSFYVMFAQPNYTFTESEVVGRVEVITGGPVPADFQVRVTGGPSEQTNIVRSADGIAETQTFPAGASSIFFDFALTDDDFLGEDVETYIASLEIVGDSIIELGSQATTQVLVLDNDAPINVMFAEPTYIFSEDNVNGNMEVITDRPAPFSFDLLVTGGPSTQSDVFISAAGIFETKTFPAGSSSITFYFDLTDDNVGLEAVESYIASLQIVGSPLGIQTGSLVQTTVIVEDDDLVTAGFAEASITVNEFEQTLTLSVILNGQAAQAVLVMVTTIPGTATDNLDYIPQTVTLTIPAGETSVNFSVEILNDTLAGEGVETFQGVIEFVFPDEVTVTQGTSQVSILDDDDGQCLALPDFTNGVISYSIGGPNQFPHNTVATYSCNNGYVLEGQRDRTCSVPEGAPTGGFDGVVPRCVPVCMELEAIENGVISYSIDNVGPEYNLSTVATYSCNNPFQLNTESGNETRTCVDGGDGVGGVFSGDAPTCDYTQCPALPDFTNGVISYSSGGPDEFPESTVATYSCNNGYVLEGEPDRNCTIQVTSVSTPVGEFDGVEPHCAPVCRELEAIENGMISYSVDNVGPEYDLYTVATYSCDPGFQLNTESGDEMRICTDGGDGIGGVFSGVAPTCDHIQCPALPDFTNGHISYSMGRPDEHPDSTVATYSCNTPGYVLQGEPDRTCILPEGTSVGEFDGVEPLCVPVCMGLEVIENGMISYAVDNVGPEYDLDTVATYSCDPGFLLNTDSGDEMRTCTDGGDGVGGVFSGVAPTCVYIQCPALPDVPNGVISYSVGGPDEYPNNTVATYSCNNGYVLEGEPERTCNIPVDTPVGEFDGGEPLCVAICMGLAIENGTISYSVDNVGPEYDLGTVATYSCNPYFKLNNYTGNETRTCVDGGDGVGGVFSGVAPTCNPLFCQPLAPVSNGILTYVHNEEISFGLGTVANLKCDLEAFQVGPKTRTCVEGDGRNELRVWSEESLRCFSLFDLIELAKQEVTVDNFAIFVAFISAFVPFSHQETPLQTTLHFNTIVTIMERVADVVVDPRSNVTTTVVEDVVSSLDGLLQWNPSILTADNTPRTCSIVKSYEEIGTIFAQENDLNITMSKLAFRSQQVQTRRIKTNVTFNAPTENGTSITLPSKLFRRIFCPHYSDNIGVLFTHYDLPHFFPVFNNTISSGRTREVGTAILGATVGRDLDIVDVDPPVVIRLLLQNPQNVSRGSEECVSWDCTTNSWKGDGCTTERDGDAVICRCTHLTNFAVLVDICSRAQDCESDAVAQKVLSVITYIGVIVSCVGLVITVITQLAFKKIRDSDSTIYHVQLSIAIFCMLVVFAAGIEQVQVYAGCVLVSVLIHYFTLVAVMWMGAEAQLMFQKLVFVFQRIRKRFKIGLSLFCWLVPLVIVLIPLIIDIVNGTDPDSDLIITRIVNDTTETLSGFCFHKHPAVFFGAFLGPIIIVLLFNFVVFFWVIHILIRHTKDKQKRSKEELKCMDIFRRLLSVCGVMFLFGLTWIFAALTFNIAGNQGLRITFQALFVVTASFQGFFIFLFFCVLKKEARDAWKEFFTLGKNKTKHTYSFSSYRGSQSMKSQVSKESLDNGSDSRPGSLKINVNKNKNTPQNGFYSTNIPMSKTERDMTPDKADELSETEIAKEIPENETNEEKELGIMSESRQQSPQEDVHTETNMNDGNESN